MEHHCNQEDRIKTIEKILIIGNGQPSILKQMATLAAGQENIVNEITKISNNVESLLTYKEQNIGATNYKGKVTSKNRFLIGTIIALSSALITIVIAIFIK
jgi:hypothetical protein